MISYHEALGRCLDAARSGEDLDAVIASLPSRYAADLRADSELAEAVRVHAATVPPPGRAAERAALARLHEELAEQQAQPSRGGWFAGFHVPRYTLAAVVVAALLITASFVLPASEEGGVEAATLEGVVLASGSETLTVQTLDSLEEISVPAGVAVVDESGAVLDPMTIEVGQVVQVRGERQPGGLVRAANVERRPNGLPGWCSDNAPRCRQLANGLERARESCESRPEGCPVIRQRVEEMIGDIGEIVRLEELRERCQEAGRDLCRDFAESCREHANVCIRPGLPPGESPEQAGERLRGARQRCDERDVLACRQIAQLCQVHPRLCPD